MHYSSSCSECNTDPRWVCQTFLSLNTVHTVLPDLHLYTAALYHPKQTQNKLRIKISHLYYYTATQIHILIKHSTHTMIWDHSDGLAEQSLTKSPKGYEGRKKGKKGIMKQRWAVHRHINIVTNTIPYIQQTLFFIDSSVTTSCILNSAEILNTSFDWLK